MKKRILFIIAALAAMIALLLPAGCADTAAPEEAPDTENSGSSDDMADIGSGEHAEKPPEALYDVRSSSALPDEDGEYTSKDDVALYIHTYNKLPKNFITKDEAEDLGWHGGGLEKYAPGKSIGGDRFGNYEGQLPEKRGRTYHECDIDTRGKKSRGAKRIVFSNDGLIYYTEDHYESFELLYGEE